MLKCSIPKKCSQTVILFILETSVSLWLNHVKDDVYELKVDNFKHILDCEVCSLEVQIDVKKRSVVGFKFNGNKITDCGDMVFHIAWVSFEFHGFTKVD